LSYARSFADRDGTPALTEDDVDEAATRQAGPMVLPLCAVR
jgi:hypothetical protein